MKEFEHVSGDDNWTSFDDAVRHIERELGVSTGKAQMILRQLCAAGEVQSKKYRMVESKDGEEQLPTPPERIAARAWRDREVDLMTDDDGCQYLVDVSGVDVRYWLHVSRFLQEQGKQARILALLSEMFPTGHVPDPAFCPRETLKTDLLARDPGLEPLDEAALTAAIDRYNARPKRS